MYVLYHGYPTTTTTPGYPTATAATYPTTPAYPTTVTLPSDFLLSGVTSPVTVPPTISIPAPQTQLALTPQPALAICRKRGSDELMSHNSPMVTNGTGLSPEHNGDMSTDAKKAKLDQVSTPSKVVHIRGLPSDVVESEIVQLGMPFGKMTNILVLKQKNQAFLEFIDEHAANTMLSYYQTSTPMIRGKAVFLQYSNHKELKTDASRSYQNATAQAALQAAQAVVVGGSDEQKTILHLIVENMMYPVTIEVLQQIFSKFGKVLKIIIFTKNGIFQSLIQFGDAIAARTAKLSLDGQNIYNGCCTLRIDYSKLSNLNVKYNNDKSRDFTNPNLPLGDSQLDSQMSLAGAMPVGYGLQNQALVNSRVGAVGAMGMPIATQMGSSVILVSNLDEQKVTPDALFTLFGVYGDVHRVKILYQKKDNALIQMAEAHQAQLAIAHLDKVRVWGKNIRVAQSKHSLVQMPKDGQPDAGLTKDFTNSPHHRFKRPGSKNCQNIFPPSPVLHLSNIPQTTTEDILRDLFCDFGTVVGFKFFQKDKKMALIQLGSDEEAIHALVGLHNSELSEQQHLKVSFSKSTIQ